MVCVYDCKLGLMERRISSLNEQHFKERTTQSEGERLVPFPLVKILVFIVKSSRKDLEFAHSSISSLEEDDSRRFDSPRGKKYLLNTWISSQRETNSSNSSMDFQEVEASSKSF